MALPAKRDQTQVRDIPNHLDAEENSEDSDVDDIVTNGTDVPNLSHKMSIPTNSPVNSQNHSPHKGKTSHELDVSDGPIQNGSAGAQVDRFGFLGGSQFTDPDQ